METEMTPWQLKHSQWKIETRLVADLIPYASNSRTHSDAQIAQIAASIKEFGWTNPILIDGDNTIIAGHGRLLAARKLGMEDVPAIILDHLSKAQQRALVIADNQLALNAGWDFELLENEIRTLADDDFNLTLLGFDDSELKKMLADVEAVELPQLADGDREPFQQMTFTLHDDQAEQVKAAMDAAKAMGPFDSPNENSNGNALARVAETFLTVAGNGNG
jgi:ParB family transcriptional regulator, chromosome partitioning protein